MFRHASHSSSHRWKLRYRTLHRALANSDAKREASAKRHPLQQIGNPDEVAALVAFLLSDAARFITGQVLRPDGGLSSVRTF